MPKVFKINRSNEDEYYTVDGVVMAADEAVGSELVYAAGLEHPQPLDYFRANYPMQYGQAVNMAIADGFKPVEIDDEDLSNLFNDELYEKLSEVDLPANTLSYFFDLFPGGDPESDEMLSGLAQAAGFTVVTSE